MLDPVSVTLDPVAAQALLDAVPVDAMAYTPAGLRVLAAYQAIQDALKQAKS